MLLAVVMLVAYPSAHVTSPTAWTVALVTKIAIMDVRVRMKLIIVATLVMLRMKIITSQGSIYQSPTVLRPNGPV